MKEHKETVLESTDKDQTPQRAGLSTEWHKWIQTKCNTLTKPGQTETVKNIQTNQHTAQF